MRLLSSPFAQGHTLLHHLDPRVKLITALFFAILISTAQQMTTLLTGLGYAGLLTLFAHPPVLALWKRLYTLNLFNFLLFLILPLTTPEEVYSSSQAFILPSPGWLLATVITLKSNAILLALTTLVSTTEIITLGQALHQLKLPPKLIHLLLFTVRYIAVFYQEYQRLTQAMTIRGFQPHFNRHTYRSLAYLIGMLLVKSLDRADRILAAMKCRGFHGQFFLSQAFSLQPPDKIFSLLAILGWLSLLTLESL